MAQKRDGEWISNAWVMKAINLYFAVAEMHTIEAGPFEYNDKIPTKKDLAAEACVSCRLGPCVTGPSSSLASL